MKYIFTDHAEDRLEKRKLSKEEVIDSIKYSNIKVKKHGKYYARKITQRGNLETVYEKTEKNIRIVTFYWL